jgi:hypothetical protein
LLRMMFEFLFITFVVLVWLTIQREYRRSNGVTLISFVSIGNIVYMGLTPALWFWARDTAAVFDNYVWDAGLTVDETGLVRLLIAAVLFQFICVCVSLSASRKRSPPLTTFADKRFIRIAICMGLVLIAVGLVGVVLMGVKYNGHPWGLYEIAYFDRAPLARDNPVGAFLLLMLIYGAAQLIVVFVFSGRIFYAAVLLFALTAHGLAMKSKFPIFWVLIVFLAVAVGRRRNFIRIGVPFIVSGMVLGAMSVLRGAENLADLPDLLSTSGDAVLIALASPWGNDIPGPVSIAYYVINSHVDFTFRPIFEILLLLVPGFVVDRGPVLSDIWAQKMMGYSYEPGLGFGWSPICDGFLLGGYVGVALVAAAFVGIARSMDKLAAKPGPSREFFVMVMYSSTPFLLYGMRESLGGLIKGLLVMVLLVWLPTYYFVNRKRRVRVRMVSESPSACGVSR